MNPQPEMYTSQEAESRDISDIVSQARICADYDAKMLVETSRLTGVEAEAAKNIASRLYSVIYVVDTLGENFSRTAEALRAMKEPKSEPVKIHVKGENTPFDVECHYREQREAEDTAEAEGIRIPVKGEGEAYNVECHVGPDAVSGMFSGVRNSQGRLREFLESRGVPIA